LNKKHTFKKAVGLHNDAMDLFDKNNFSIGVVLDSIAYVY
jgi:hypothetical protein